MNKRLRNYSTPIRRLGVEQNLWDDIYHRLLRISWTRFFALFLMVYIAINSFFALLFWIQPDAIASVREHDFLSYFAFSVQTFSTIGYGHMYPQTAYADWLVAIEASAGLFSTALLTGLMFSKFAKVSARVVFSENILLTTQNGKPVLSLRLGNVRTNRVFEGKARMTLLKDEISDEGEKLRRLVDLKLVRNETPIFALSWTVFHLIDETSPLYNITPEAMHDQGWEIIVTFNGFDQDMAQTIADQSTYSAKRIIRARKFVDMIDMQAGMRVIDFSKLHEIEH